MNDLYHKTTLQREPSATCLATSRKAASKSFFNAAAYLSLTPSTANIYIVKAWASRIIHSRYSLSAATYSSSVIYPSLFIWTPLLEAVSAQMPILFWKSGSDRFMTSCWGVIVISLRPLAWNKSERRSAIPLSIPASERHFKYAD